MPGPENRARTALFIGCQTDEHESLRGILQPLWEFHGAFTVRQGIEVLRRNHQIRPVVITDQILPDGDWRLLISELEKLPVRWNLIVCSRLADERLWAEVLNLGAYDLIRSDPFEPDEVLRVADSAWRDGMREREFARASHLIQMFDAVEHRVGLQRSQAAGVGAR
jgi:DNA-binding NtrC family response regulator